MDFDSVIKRVESVTHSGFYSAASFKDEDMSPAIVMELKKAGYDVTIRSKLF